MVTKKIKTKKKEEVKSENNFLEINYKGISLKINKDLEAITTAKRILLVWEFELKKLISEDKTEKKEIIEDKKEDLSDVPKPEGEIIIETPEIPESPVINEFIEKCPKCNSKIKTKTKKVNDNIVKIIKCKKNKWFRGKCDFMQEFSHKI